MKPLVRTLHDLDLIRLAVVSPESRVADVPFNLSRMQDAVTALAKEGCQVIAFPELGLSSYSCADLFFSTNFAQAGTGWALVVGGIER